jgi:plastocyanin
VRRALATLLLAGAALAGTAGAARAEDATIRMPGKFFDPARSTAVVGDRVSWRNVDLVAHDVRIPAVAFDSGPIARSGSWTETFDRPGEYPFICTLHAFMRGSLSVVAATLDARPDGVLAGEPLTLSGRAPAGSGALALERAAAGGAWTALDAPVVPDADGTFAVDTPAVEGAAYRIATPAGASPVVTPQVTAKVDLHVTLRRGHHRRALEVHAMPAPPGMVATLELYARWRYRWRDVETARLGRDGMTRLRFRLPHGEDTYARVSLRRRARGPALVHSRVVRTSDGRTGQDPDAMPMPPMHHGDDPSGHAGH